MKNNIYTLGHSNLSLENFLKLLNFWNINCVIDVRSTPYSIYTPQFNKEALANALKEKGIIYLHFKEEFGARPTDKSMYEKGQVVFEKMTGRAIFKKGVERLEKGISQGYRITLMCACGDPLSCHCFFMICKYLMEQRNFSISHIFPYNKNKYHGLLSENEKEAILIKENSKELKYFIKTYNELIAFDYQKFKIKKAKKEPRREGDLFNEAENVAEYEKRLKEKYFPQRNKEIGYKL